MVRERMLSSERSWLAGMYPRDDDGIGLRVVSDKKRIVASAFEKEMNSIGISWLQSTQLHSLWATFEFKVVTLSFSGDDPWRLQLLTELQIRF